MSRIRSDLILRGVSIQMDYEKNKLDDIFAGSNQITSLIQMDQGKTNKDDNRGLVNGG